MTLNKTYKICQWGPVGSRIQLTESAGSGYYTIMMERAGILESTP
jgi:hypothetical protein